MYRQDRQDSQLGQKIEKPASYLAQFQDDGPRESRAGRPVEAFHLFEATGDLADTVALDDVSGKGGGDRRS